MPNPFLVPLIVVWGAVPQIIDNIFGTNIAPYFTDELLAEITLAPFVWGLKILQNLIF